jgi:Fe2+ transport system protein B
VSRGKCIGTLNVLRREAEWREEQITLVRALGIAALAGALMMNG